MSSSLIVPAYNEEEVIQDTLDHLTDLEPYFDEIYLMDDASTDSTHEKIESYLQENDTEVKVAYMRENGDKVGAIQEAVRHTDTDNVFLTDADTRFSNPEEIENAEKHMEEEDLDGLALKVIPDYSSDNIFEHLWNRAQDFEYGTTRSFSDYTTGDTFRQDPDYKKVRVAPGAGAVYRTESLELALENHSGNHAGDDIETTAYIQLQMDGSIDHYDQIVMETDVPKSYSDLVSQRKRWMKGGFQSFHEHPIEHVKESLSGSRYGQILAMETVGVVSAPLLIGKAGFEASQGDFAGTFNSLEHLVEIQAGLAATCGGYASIKDDFADKKTIPFGSIMPFYKPAVVLPSLLGAEKDIINEEISETRKEFTQGLEEGNEDYETMRNLGRAFEKSKQKAQEIFSFGDEEAEEILEPDREQNPVAAD